MVFGHVLKVNSPAVTHTDEHIISKYVYQSTLPSVKDGVIHVEPTSENYEFRTEKTIPKLGVMLVGLGGNNGTTVTGGIIANREGISWNTKMGIQKSDFYGSLTQCGSMRMGIDKNGEEVNVPLKSILPMAEATELVITGWDINKKNLGEAMKRAQVFEYDLQRQLYPHMEKIQPMPSIYFPSFIAANQEDRADNCLEGSKMEQMEMIRKNIRDFKKEKNLDKVITLWTANTERFSEIIPGINDTWANLHESIKKGEDEVSPSTLFAVASILEGTTYINGSPQNTFVPGVIELALEKRVFIAGDDFKSGQTKMKSVLVDFLVGAGLKTTSIVSYNHLGNNDGKNLSAPAQFRSKEISKSNVVDDMVASNGILYPDDHPDHCVVIKYVPYVGDSKRALDEYTSEIFMGGHNTIVLHNTCEDSLLAAPLIIDLILLSDLAERITLKREGSDEYERFHPVLSILSYLLKAPMVPENTPVVNALFRQRAAIENLLRACVGLPPDNNMLLKEKLLN